MSSKKKNKAKGVKLSMQEFLGSGPLAPEGAKTVILPSKTSWADDTDGYDDDSSRIEKISLPTAPRAARGPDVDLDKVPTRPPFTAYVGNLPYETEEDDIHHFFKELHVTSVRLPRDTENGRLKGFGYAEFPDRESLLKALGMDELLLKNRKIRVSLGQENEKRQQRPYGSSDDPDRTQGDWRTSGGSRGFDDRSRNYDDKGYSSRSNYGSRYESKGDRYEPPRDRYEPPRDRYEPPRDRYEPPRDRYEPPRDRYEPPRDRYESSRDRYDSPRDRYDDRGGRWRNDDGDRRRNDDGDRRRSEDGDRRWERREQSSSERTEEESAPRTRPKLNIKPRTKPLEESGSAPVQSSIFGGAKPVDTAAKEREIENRLNKGEDRRPTEPIKNYQPRKITESLKPYKEDKKEETSKKSMNGEKPKKQSEEKEKPSKKKGTECIEVSEDGFEQIKKSTSRAIKEVEEEAPSWVSTNKFGGIDAEVDLE